VRLKFGARARNSHRVRRQTASRTAFQFGKHGPLAADVCVARLFGLERGATDRRRPDLADLLTPLRGGETVNMNESPPSPLLAGSFPDVSPHGGGNQSGQLWGRIAVGGERGVRGENLKGGGRVKEVVTDRTAGLQDRRRRGVAGAVLAGEARPATAGSRRLRRAGGGEPYARRPGGGEPTPNSAAVAAVLAICAANCRGPGLGAVRRRGGRGPPWPVEIRRICAGAGNGWLCRENRPQDRLGIVGGWWAMSRAGLTWRSFWGRLGGGLCGALREKLGPVPSGYTLATLQGVARLSEVVKIRIFLRKNGLFGDYGSEGSGFDSLQVRHFCVYPPNGLSIKTVAQAIPINNSRLLPGACISKRYIGGIGVL